MSLDMRPLDAVTRGVLVVLVAVLATLVAATAGAPDARAGGGPECTGPAAGDLTCLACNVYYEARGESDEGQLAVAMVTLNRLRSPYFPKSVCEVVWERHRDIRSGQTVAQFSWTLEPRVAVDGASPAWDKAQRLAHQALAGAGNPAGGPADPSLGATFFHASWANPPWAGDRGLAFATRIGGHLFYRLRDGGAIAAGAAGAAGAAAFVGPFPLALAPEASLATGIAFSGAVSWMPAGGRLIHLAAHSGPAGQIRAISYENGRMRAMAVVAENQ
jgi:spore germination cell wall hydrolase CwlJ-like protein